MITKQKLLNYKREHKESFWDYFMRAIEIEKIKKFEFCSKSTKFWVQKEYLYREFIDKIIEKKIG